ncbi:CBS domain-containing protein [Pseudarcicella hirudinis]|uniref:CBS domain-containing protein n=1 Tax=Pseudarcicella hirudinis TaxID=1079859 RepID=A0A1I5QID2_9BACT|nr:CBS domain-containing protein [Pseudarcicella hirudinis]SFP46019.1 CBS domain-containing protein [Pseudarcicella hirudinis]
MKKVSNLIQGKGSTVTTIEATKTVYEALEVMVENNIGAIIVLHEGEYIGLLTERDYARKVILKGKHSQETLVGDIMQNNPPNVTFNDTIEKCMEIMSDKHIRYLPVVTEKEVKGLVSMGDLVRFIIEDQKHTIENLQNYISGAV